MNGNGGAWSDYDERKKQGTNHRDRYSHRDKEEQRAPHLVNGPFPHFDSNKHLPVSSLNLRKNTNASGKWISSYTFLMGSFKSNEETIASEIAPTVSKTQFFKKGI